MAQWEWGLVALPMLRHGLLAVGVALPVGNP
jgi:hypothetical protein